MAAAFIFMVAALVITKKVEEYYGVDGDALLAQSQTNNAYKQNNTGKGSQRVSDGNAYTEMEVSVKDVEDKGNNAEGVAAPTEAGTTTLELKVLGTLNNEDWNKRSEAGLTGARIDQVVNQSRGKYYFDNMPDELRQAYAEVYILVTGRAVEVPLCIINEDDIDKVFNCVLSDYPEIFYVSGYSYIRHLTGNQVIKVDFSAKYTHSEQDVADAYEYLEKYYEKFESGLPVNASEYEKVKYTYEFIIINTEYNLAAPDNQNIMSVAYYRESVCLGYAKMFQYLLNRLGVECTLCVGKCNGEGHAWNLVNVDGSYYYVDVTWGDASYSSAFTTTSPMSEVVYDYLLVTTDDISSNHVFECVVPMPRCISTANNYYVKEGLYFINVDKAGLNSAFERGYMSGSGICTIKCANKVIYNDMYKHLIDDQKVFDYIKGGSDSLSYGMNEEALTYTFILE